MVIYLFLGVLNGILIGISRVINGRLSIGIGPFKASFWNHFVGFLFLTLLMLLIGNPNWNLPTDAPLHTYLGGFLGVLFVAINSYVLPRIGTVKTVLLVISGQMVTGVFLDYQRNVEASTLFQFLGVGMILFGIYLSKTSRGPRRNSPQ